MPPHIAPTPGPLPVPARIEHEGVQALSAGLLAERPRIAAKYLYDELGSRLFEAITLLPEYYPTRTEQAILTGCIPEIAARTGSGATFIDLGAGNCAKARTLLPGLQPARYLAIDIAGEFLHAAVAGLARRFPHIGMSTMVQDFSAGLHLPADLPRAHRLFFYPGSSLGNFTPTAAAALLADVRRHCDEDGALLIGVDLIKDPAVLHAAYDDALGLTAAFNLNVLRHVNRLLGADFHPALWRHRAHFDAGHARMDLHLEARQDLYVRWPGSERHFRAGERIHTEHSHKYTRAGIEQMLRAAGFASVHTWLDPRHWFAVCLASTGALH